ncbi:MAG: hypothetical protein RJQ09_09215 [Cyclobacteriaceae bacterium]
MTRTISFLICLAVITACGDDELPFGDDNTSIIVDDNNQFAPGIIDPSGDGFEIADVVVGDSTVDVTVRYSGGCEAHIFDFTHSIKKVGTQVLVELNLVHSGNGDTCEAYPTTTVPLEVGKVAEIKQAMTDGNVIFRVVNAYDMSSWVAVYGMPAFPESQDCIFEIDAEDVICGDGLFANTWFKYAEVDGGPVYLQPSYLGSLSILSSNELEEGRYKVGVGLSEPFQSDPNIGICQAYPGPSLPVVIYCIEKI